MPRGRPKGKYEDVGFYASARTKNVKVVKSDKGKKLIPKSGARKYPLYVDAWRWIRYGKKTKGDSSKYEVDAAKKKARKKAFAIKNRNTEGAKAYKRYLRRQRDNKPERKAKRAARDKIRRMAKKK